MDHFTKWPEAYAIPNQETLTVVKALVTNLCYFKILPELCSDQDHNFESRLMQEVLHCLGVNKTYHNPTPSIRQHGRVMHQNDQGAHMKRHCLHQWDWGERYQQLLIEHPLMTLLASPQVT
jgi:hypothetical protein